MLERRVEVNAEKLISTTQNAFVEGGSIMDGILSLHELLHHTRAKKKE